MVDEEDPSPRWDSIVSMYDDLDNLVGKYVSEKEMNYLEVECALMMLREKSLIWISLTSGEIHL